MIGPPRPPPQLPTVHEEAEDEDGAMVGPPRPPPSKEGDEDEDEDEDEDDGDDDDDDDMDDDGEDFGRIPLSNEIVLRGHTKVTALRIIYFSTSNCLVLELL